MRLPFRHTGTGSPFSLRQATSPGSFRKAQLSHWDKANVRFQTLSNPGHRPLELAGLTIARPKALIRENLAECLGDDGHHA